MSVYNVYLAQDGTILCEEAEGAVFSRSNKVNTIRVWDTRLDAAETVHRLNMTRADGKKPASVYLAYVGVKTDTVAHDETGVNYGKCAVFEYTLTGYQLAVAGELACSVDIVDPSSDVLLTTAAFTVTVKQSLDDNTEDAPEDDNVYRAQLQELTALFQRFVTASGAGTVAVPISASAASWTASGVRRVCKVGKNMHGLDRPTFVCFINNSGTAVLADVTITADGDGNKTVVTLTADNPIGGTLYLCNTYQEEE